MYETVFAEEEDADKKKKNKKLHIVSGCTRGSSFVGYVHLFRNESSESTQESETVAKSVAKTTETELFLISIGKTKGDSRSVSKAARSLLSNSQLENSCFFDVEGLIPTLECGEMATTVQTMKPDGAESASALATLAGAATDKTKTSMQSMVGEGKIDQSFMTLNNDHFKTSVRTYTEASTPNNKVVDMNTMFTALDEFVRKAMEGDMGVPLTYFLKEIDKKEIAKTYMRRYYPNGVRSASDLRKGLFGIDDDDDKK